jgi:hypothetical protein
MWRCWRRSSWLLNTPPFTCIPIERSAPDCAIIAMQAKTRLPRIVQFVEYFERYLMKRLRAFAARVRQREPR